MEENNLLESLDSNYVKQINKAEEELDHNRKEAFANVKFKEKVIELGLQISQEKIIEIIKLFEQEVSNEKDVEKNKVKIAALKEISMSRDSNF